MLIPGAESLLKWMASAVADGCQNPKLSEQVFYNDIEADKISKPLGI
jgi:hypothetical protein